MLITWRWIFLSRLIRKIKNALTLNLTSSITTFLKYSTVTLNCLWYDHTGTKKAVRSHVLIWVTKPSGSLIVTAVSTVCRWVPVFRNNCQIHCNSWMMIACLPSELVPFTCTRAHAFHCQDYIVKTPHHSKKWILTWLVWYIFSNS